LPDKKQALVWVKAPLFIPIRPSLPCGRAFTIKKQPSLLVNGTIFIKEKPPLAGETPATIINSP